MAQFALPFNLLRRHRIGLRSTRLGLFSPLNPPTNKRDMETDLPLSTSPSTQNAKRRVLICYPYFAHYRLPIVRELAHSLVAEFSYTSDTATNVEGLALIAPETGIGDKAFSDFHTPIRNRWFLDRFLWQSGLLRQVLRGDYDVLILLANMYYITSWLAALIARARGKRVLMWGHGFIKSSRSPLERVRALFYQIANGHMLYGCRAREIMRSYRINPNSIYVIYNSLDLTAQALAMARIKDSGEYDRLLRLNCETIKLFFVGRLTPHKRLDLLIDAVGELNKRGYRVLCKIVGEGAIEADLKSRCQTMGISDQIIFTGAIYDENVLAREIVGNDLCVIPGKVGLTCMHAMAYGVPVITNNDFDGQNPEVEAIIPSVTGAFFQKNNAIDLADKIIAWTERQVPREIVAKECHRIIAERYNPKSQKIRMEAAVMDTGPE